MFTTGAVYVGVPFCPGFPLWTLYASLFARLPISNLAWRVGVSSAVAAALASGCAALLASRCSSFVLANEYNNISPPQMRRLRTISSFVAGMAFGLDTAVWQRAVIADPWPPTFLLFAITLCLLLYGQHAPNQKLWLCAAFFAYGLTLLNCQGLIIAAPGLALFILCQNAALARGLFTVITLLYAALFTAYWTGLLSDPVEILTQFDNLRFAHALIGCCSASISLALILKTRCIFQHWRLLGACAACLALGMSFYFLLPIFSTATPPVNWGYPRTLAGFQHLVSRGQFERIYPTYTPSLAQLRIYFHSITSDFGWLYLLPALLPIFYLHRLPKPERNCLLGLLALFPCLSLFMLAMLNPDPDFCISCPTNAYFVPSHFILTLFLGPGLTRAAQFLHARRPMFGA
jgi:Protein of unknown function (DUF2723)